MGQLTITFTGMPHELHAALAELGYVRAAAVGVMPRFYESEVPKGTQSVGGNKARDDLNARTTEDIVADLRNATTTVKATDAEKKSAEEPAETVTAPHSATEIRDALAAVAKEEADKKKKEAADRRAKKAEAKRQEDAAARAAAAVNAVETDQAADPNGASLDALLSQDPKTEIPEHLTEEAKAEAETAESGADDDDLSALLGETSSEVVEDDGRRAKFEAMSAEDLNAAIRDLMKKKGVPWLKNVLAEAKKSNLGQMTREEMIEVLVQVD